jgi:acetyl-CoA carboxylase carboxyltransferase component
MRHNSRKSWCAVHSSALIDGTDSLQQGSGEAIAAQFSIGVTEPHHRHSGVVQLHVKCVATGKIARVLSSLICTRSRPLSRSSMFNALQSWRR